VIIYALFMCSVVAGQVQPPCQLIDADPGDLTQCRAEANSVPGRPDAESKLVCLKREVPNWEMTP
jgi:hypothetical protein